MKIKGPLGFWPFPLLNLFMQLFTSFNYQSGRKKIYKLVRDKNGRIVEVIEVEV